MRAVGITGITLLIASLLMGCGKKNFTAKLVEEPAPVEKSGEPEPQEELTVTEPPVEEGNGEFSVAQDLFEVGENEGQTSVFVPFEEPSKAMTIKVTTEETGDADANEDFYPISSQIIEINEGDLDLEVNLHLINDVLYDVTDETFSVVFRNVENNEVIDSITIKIMDDEDRPSLIQAGAGASYSPSETAVDQILLSHGVDQPTQITLTFDQNEQQARANCNPGNSGYDVAIPFVDYEPLPETLLMVPVGTLGTQTFEYKWLSFSNNKLACFYASVEFLDN